MKTHHKRATAIMCAAGLLASGMVIGGLTADKPAPVQRDHSAMIDDLPSVKREVGAHAEGLGEDTDEGRDSAIDLKNRYAAHFKCGDYPEGDKLQYADLIPTGNVVMTIEYDRNTKSYRVIKADPRIKVQYYVGTNPSFDGPEAYEDVFALHPAKGVEIYGWYVEYLSPDGNGKTEWVNGDADFAYGGNDLHRIVASRNENNNTVRYVVVGTDTRTCRPGPNTVPNAMWPELIKREVILVSRY